MGRGRVLREAVGSHRGDYVRSSFGAISLGGGGGGRGLLGSLLPHPRGADGHGGGDERGSGPGGGGGVAGGLAGGGCVCGALAGAGDIVEW